jgi:hypothetical protein
MRGCWASPSAPTAPELGLEAGPGPIYYAVAEDRVYVAHAGPGGAPPDGGANAPAARRVEVAAAGWYKPLCDDFGPQCLSVVPAFVRRLDAELAAAGPAGAVAVWVEPCRQQATNLNAVFLAGALAVLRLGQSAAAVAHAVEGLDVTQTEPYRDAAYLRPDFGLALQYCWRALERARDLCWFHAPRPERDGSPGRPGPGLAAADTAGAGAGAASSEGSTLCGAGFGGSRSQADSQVWGRVDLLECAGLPVADPAHGDLHVVIPDSLAAFRGPVAVPLNGVPGAVEMAATLRRLGPTG